MKMKLTVIFRTTGVEVFQKSCKLVTVVLRMRAIEFMQWDSLDFVSEKSGCRVVDFIDRWRHFVLLIWSI